MLAEMPHSACLGALFPHFLYKGHANAEVNLRRATVYHAVLMKIDFAAIVGLDEAKSCIRIEARYHSRRLCLMCLDLPPHSPSVILQLPPSAAECVA